MENEPIPPGNQEMESKREFDVPQGWIKHHPKSPKFPTKSEIPSLLQLPDSIGIQNP